MIYLTPCGAAPVHGSYRDSWWRTRRPSGSCPDLCIVQGHFQTIYESLHCLFIPSFFCDDHRTFGCGHYEAGMLLKGIPLLRQKRSGGDPSLQIRRSLVKNGQPQTVGSVGLQTSYLPSPYPSTHHTQPPSLSLHRIEWVRIPSTGTLFFFPCHPRFFPVLILPR